MQNIQSQLGKSLSLQLLMTVPRRNFPSNDPAWLQVEGLNVLQLLRANLSGANSCKIPHKFKSLGLRFAMQQWTGLPAVRRLLGYNSLGIV